MSKQRYERFKGHRPEENNSKTNKQIILNQTVKNPTTNNRDSSNSNKRDLIKCYNSGIYQKIAQSQREN